MTRRLILFSGMGADGRLMKLLRVPEVELVTPDHLPPVAEEALSEYAGRVAAAHRVRPADIVGGVSFGSMLAAEISRQLPVTGLILLGSTVRPAALPWFYKWVERFGRLIPDFLLGARTVAPIIRWRFAPLTAEAEASLIEMAKAFPPAHIRAFGSMVISWQGLDRVPCPLLSVHGDSDRIIPLKCAEPGLILNSAGHAFTLTHAAEVSQAIEAFLKYCPSE